MRTFFFFCFIEIKIPDWRNSVIVARKPNQTKRVTGFAQRLKLNIAVIHGFQDRESESEEIDGRNSPPLTTSDLDNFSGRRSVFTIPSLALGERNFSIEFNRFIPNYFICRSEC